MGNVMDSLEGKQESDFEVVKKGSNKGEKSKGTTR